MQHSSLKVKCPSFAEDGRMPPRHTGFGEDVSPEFLIEGLGEEVQMLAIVMDDLDVPIVGCLNHWLIWNVPAANRIAEHIPHAPELPNGARQGVGYGKNGYRGPKQPPFIRKAHRYRFTVYGLDGPLELPPTARKAELLKAMEGHVLQSAELVGWYKPQ